MNQKQAKQWLSTLGYVCNPHAPGLEFGVMGLAVVDIPFAEEYRASGIMRAINEAVFETGVDFGKKRLRRQIKEVLDL